MKKVVFYQIVCAVLTLIIAYLLYSVNQKEKRPPHNRNEHSPRARVIKRLNFNEKQIARYDELIEQHVAAVDELDRKINRSKRALYESLNDTSLNNDSLIETIGATQMQIEQIHLNHFRNIKDICKEDQLGDYQLLTKDLLKVFRSNRLKPRGHGRPEDKPRQ
jgi:uncharacterized membrane-anchored protein YhcB (DUF1043 family)